MYYFVPFVLYPLYGIKYSCDIRRNIMIVTDNVDYTNII